VRYGCIQKISEGMGVRRTGQRSLIRQQRDRPLMSGPKLGQPKLRVNVWLCKLWGQAVRGSEMNRIRTQDVVVANRGANYV